MPADGAQVVRQHDAALFGAVGRPDVPDHELVWGLIIGLRQQLDLAVNIRPVVAFAGVPTSVRGTDGVDLVIVRENTEGEYVGAGGVAHAGTRRGHRHRGGGALAACLERAAHHAFTLAAERGDRLTLVTKTTPCGTATRCGTGSCARSRSSYPDVELRDRARRRHGRLAWCRTRRSLDVLRGQQPLRRHPLRPGRHHRG